MGDKEEKKKKKKSKKKEDEEGAPPPEPEPAPEPAFPAGGGDDEGGDWLSSFEEKPAEEAPADGEGAPEGEEGAPPGEGEEQPAEGEEPEDEDMPVEKRKSPYPVFWNRPKAKMYRMNFDYGENYYSNMINYLDAKTGYGRRLDGHPPKAETWAERAHRSAKVRYPKQDSDLSDLLHTVRTNIRGYDARHKEYTSKVQTVYGPKAY